MTPEQRTSGDQTEAVCHGGRAPAGSALRADGLLLIVAAVWGSGFVAQRSAMEHMGPMAFTALRYGLGALVLVPVLLWFRARVTRGVLLAGCGLGAAMFVAAGLQQVGLVTTTASRAGFITGLYVLAVPLVGWFAGERATAGHLLGAVLAVLGLAMLSGVGLAAGGGLSVGDLLVCGCALAWAVHVVLVARVAPRMDALALAVVQFVVVAALAGLATLLFESPTAAGIWAGRVSIAYSGVLVIGVAFTLQIVAQRTAPATHAAIIMSLEAVFGAACGVWLLSERLAWFEWLGCGLMLAGVVVSQVWPGVSARLRRARLRDPVR